MRELYYLIGACREKVDEINRWKSSLYNLWKGTVAKQVQLNLVIYKLYVLRVFLYCLL